MTDHAPTRVETHASALALSLPIVDAEAVAAARREADERPIAYPLGSGQAEEIALAAGIRPLIRQMLGGGEIEAARARFQRAGLLAEVAPRVYGPTHEGWDHTPEPLAADAPGARRALFVGRDRARIAEAIEADLAKTDDADRELGRLLGYPRCCVDAFVDASYRRLGPFIGRERRNVDLYAAALAATEREQPSARLNMLDLGVFHYVSWSPCSFACALSRAYADAVAKLVARRNAPFVARVDAALSAHRLVLVDEVQISLRGPFDGEAVTVTEAWATARDRHPGSRLAPAEREAIARALAMVRRARTVAVKGSSVWLDGEQVPWPSEALLVPFGASGDRRAEPR